MKFNRKSYLLKLLDIYDENKSESWSLSKSRGLTCSVETTENIVFCTTSQNEIIVFVRNNSPTLGKSSGVDVVYCLIKSPDCVVASCDVRSVFNLLCCCKQQRRSTRAHASVRYTCITLLQSDLCYWALMLVICRLLRKCCNWQLTGFATPAETQVVFS